MIVLKEVLTATGAEQAYKRQWRHTMLDLCLRGLGQHLVFGGLAPWESKFGELQVVLL